MLLGSEMKTLDITPEDSIKHNLSEWCYEVGSEYEKHSRKSAERFIGYINKQPVVDLGSGDGAATNVFVANGNPTTAVDINPEKLAKIRSATTEQTDFLTYLSKPVDNIFMHHSLEHCPNPMEILSLIAKHLKRGSYCYIAVPKGDEPHSVHHAAFESVDEIVPPGLEVIESGESDDPSWPEYRVIARKK